MTTSYRKPPAWLLFPFFAYAALLVALTVLNRVGADRWWFGAVNLYLPQVVWALPGIVLLLVTLRRAPRWFWLPLLGVLWVAGPLMGFCWPLHSPAEPPGGESLRVMTWNVKYAARDHASHLALRRDIELHKPDVVLMQDAQEALTGPLKELFRGWHVRVEGQFVVASRFPLGRLQLLRLSPPGGDSVCVRTVMRLNGSEVALYNVHLESPRNGLNALRVVKRKPGVLPQAVQTLTHNVEARFSQVQALQQHLRQEQLPMIVAGDLNSPDPSRVCSALRDAGLHDAFAEGGKGYGYTYGHFLLQHRIPSITVSWMRIDHIMMSSRFRATRCRTGTYTASDHRPVIADLVLRVK
jgi:endonuclease/exonuclease/phosphatase (EEP) superfamily protein YafD